VTHRFVSLALLAAASITFADPVVIIDTADTAFRPGFPVYTEDPVTGKWTVDIDVEEKAGSTCCGIRVFVESTDEIVIERINVTGSTPFGSSFMQLIVRGDELSGSITSVESVNWIDPGFGRNPTPVDLTIDLHPTLGSGRIGDGVDSNPTTIESHNVFRLMARSLEADVVTLPGGDIRTIDIDGDIGKTTNEVAISADDDILDIRAKNIYADIDATNNVESIRVFGSGSDTVAATDAVFDGTLDCDTMNNGLGLRV